MALGFARAARRGQRRNFIYGIRGRDDGQRDARGRPRSGAIFCISPGRSGICRDAGGVGAVERGVWDLCAGHRPRQHGDRGPDRRGRWEHTAGLRQIGRCGAGASDRAVARRERGDAEPLYQRRRFRVACRLEGLWRGYGVDRGEYADQDHQPVADAEPAAADQTRDRHPAAAATLSAIVGAAHHLDREFHQGVPQPTSPISAAPILAA